MRRFLLPLLLVCLAIPAAAQGHALKAIWGPLDLPNGHSAGPTYRALGVDVLQMSLTWPGSAATRPADPRNPADPAYTWDPSIDKAIAMGRKYGFTVALLVKGTPQWANGGKD